MNHNQTKTKTLKLVGYKPKELILTLLFLATSIITPTVLAHTPNNQWITGTIINSILFISCYRLGFVNAVLVAVTPSIVAITRGLLPVSMATMLPFIIASNIILLSSFSFLNFKSLIAKIVTASTLKFAFLFFVAYFVLNLPSAFRVMMSYPQLITAISGGLIAYFIIQKFYKKTQKEA